MANRENVETWVSALRSGEYEQGLNRLKTATGKFCCLGVACDVSGLGTWEGENPAYVTPSESLGAAESVMPEPVQEWLGIHEGDPGVRVQEEGGGTRYRNLSGLNDVDHLSFAQIADVIESEWLR